MESGNWKAEAILGAVVIGVIVVFVWLTFSFGGGAPRDARPYVLLFDSALGLSIDNTVAIAGVRIGVVDEIAVAGRQAKVTVLIDPDVVLHDDAKAAVRQKTLLGEKYVDINPGSDDHPALAAGAVLDNNEGTIDIDQIMRAANELIARLNRLTPSLERAAFALDGALDSDNGQKLISDAGGALQELRTLIVSVNSVVKRSGDDLTGVLRIANEKAPGMIERIDVLAAHADELLAAIDPQSIKAGVDMIGPAADNIDRITIDAKVAMGDVREAAKRLDTLLGRIDSTLARLEWIDEPMIREFLQVQGVRVNLLPDPTVTARIKKLRDDHPAAPPAPEPNARLHVEPAANPAPLP